MSNKILLNEEYFIRKAERADARVIAHLFDIACMGELAKAYKASSAGINDDVIGDIADLVMKEDGFLSYKNAHVAVRSSGVVCGAVSWWNPKTLLDKGLPVVPPQRFEAEQELIGIVLNKYAATGTFYVPFLAVLVSDRTSNVTNMLKNKMLEIFNCLDLPVAHLIVLKSNRAKLLYIRAGFVATGDTRPYGSNEFILYEKKKGEVKKHTTAKFNCN